MVANRVLPGSVKFQLCDPGQVINFPSLFPPVKWAKDRSGLSGLLVDGGRLANTKP